jgi:TolB protein
MNADGSGQHRLTAQGAQPGWSPDGQKIAFMTERDGNPEIYTMNADGSGQRNLTRTRGPKESGLVWSPATKP